MNTDARGACPVPTLAAALLVLALVGACGGAASPPGTARATPPRTGPQRDDAASSTNGPIAVLAVFAPPVLQFVTAPDCEACTVGREVLQAELEARAEAGARPVRLQVVEASARPELLARYGGRLPILLVGDAVLSDAVDRVRVRVFLVDHLDATLAGIRDEDGADAMGSLAA